MSSDKKEFQSHSYCYNWLFAVIFSVVFQMSYAEAQNIQPDNKELKALKLMQDEPDVDGKLDDACWKRASFTSDFLQKEPNEFGTPTVKTEAAIAYDGTYLYVAARMYDDNPYELRQDIDRRDNQGVAEQFIISFDTYHDKRTAYAFGVSTSGVRMDRYHPDDNPFSRDFSYNPVWEAKTSINDSSWTVEMKIPFSQLRFNKLDKQVWGLNINRWIPSRNEDIFWVVIPRDDNAFVSKFGTLTEIENIEPSKRLELLPYAASDGSFTGNYLNNNPFEDGSQVKGRIGADLKMGLGPNLTLDATFNPDFGQVEADPAVINLSAYETFFDERRPFFTEGKQLFEGVGPSYFYSRRIGGAPHGSVDGTFASRPANSTILGATKITGRLSSGTSVATLVALTDEEYGEWADTLANGTAGNISKEKVEPRTFYFVNKIKQEFGKNKSTIGFLLTAVRRDLSNNDPLAEILTKSALTGGADWNIRFDEGNYELLGHAGFSHITGDSKVIIAKQTSSAHYFQRPDADHVEVDSSRTSMSGYTGSLRFRKNGGKHWLWNMGIALESPGLELNDVGILGAADDIDGWTGITYRENTPDKFYRNYNFNVNYNQGWNFGNVIQYKNLNINGNLQWKNYWNSWFYIGRQFESLTDNRTRGGPLMKNRSSWTFEAGGSNNYVSNTRLNFWIGGWKGDPGESDFWMGGEVSSRIGDKIQLSLAPRFSLNDDNYQYVDVIDSAGPSETFGKSYLFARLEQSNISLQIRFNYYFTPDLSLQVYGEPFAASGKYIDEGILAEAGNNEFIPTGNDRSDLDFGYQSFRSNLVLRWEYMPGSTAYFVWQRNLSDNKDPGRTVRPSNLFDSFGSTGTDFIGIKISSWISVS